MKYEKSMVRIIHGFRFYGYRNFSKPLLRLLAMDILMMAALISIGKAM